MSTRRRPARNSRLLGAIALLVLLALLVPLGIFVSGLLPGGNGRRGKERRPDAERETGTIEICVVRAEDRSPIEGARVFVEGLTGGEAEARSDGSGRARLGDIRGGPVRIEASYGGRSASAWADPTVQREVLLAVGPEPVLAGRVTDARGPRAGARVALLAADGRELASTETRDDGTYELPDLAEAASVCADADGFAPTTVARGDIRLDEGTLVEGRIAGAGEGPLAVFGQFASASSDDMLPFRAQWRVGAGGEFRGRLPAGVPAFGVIGGRPFRVAPGEVELPAPVHARGVVRRSDGAPASRALLLFRPLVDLDFPAPLPGLRVEADADGGFSAAGLADVRYSVEVAAPGCASTVVPEVSPGRGPIEIRLEPGFNVSGFVVDTRGLPVPGARIRAIGVPETSERPVLSTQADSHGRFRVAGLGGATARIRVTADGYHAATLDAIEPDSTLRLVLQANG